MRTCVCFDFETGGFSPLKNPITEVGMLSFRLDNFKEIGRMEALCRGYSLKKWLHPTKPSVMGLPPKELWLNIPDGERSKRGGTTQIMKANNYTETKDETAGNLYYEWSALTFTNMSPEKLSTDGISADKVMDKIIEFLKEAKLAKGYTKKPILVGHNVQFDIGFLQYLANYCDKDLSKYLDGKIDGYGNFTPFAYDTMHLSRLIFANDLLLANNKLETVAAHVNVDLSDAHSAMPDVVATKEVFCNFISMMRSSGENKGRAYRTRDKYQF